MVVEAKARLQRYHLSHFSKAVTRSQVIRLKHCSLDTPFHRNSLDFPGIPSPPPRNLGQFSFSRQLQNLPLSETCGERQCQTHNRRKSCHQSCDHAAVCLSMASTTFLINILSTTVSYLTLKPKTFRCSFLCIFSTLLQVNTLLTVIDATA